MTKIKIFRQNDIICGFECSGHSGYAEEGFDIVCSAISSLTLTAILGIQNIAKAKYELKRDDNQGYLKLMLKSQNEQELDKSQTILQTMVLGLKQIAKAYKKHIKLEDDYEIF